jgi:hypothetical protein
VKRAAAVLVVGSASLLVAGASSGRPGVDIRWRQFAHVPGAVDVAGPRADGRMVVAARAGLFLLRRDGSLSPFARGANGYVPARGEAYIALAEARRLPQSGCSFRRDDVYALAPVDQPGVTLIERTGRARRFVRLPAGSFLSSIAYDGVGRFGNRLLVTAIIGGKTTLYAVDCLGRSRVLVSGAARVEGGSAVAPRSFGRFGGRLIAVDELTGSIYAFDAQGRVRLVARPKLPTGQDTGVESVGFVPSGFSRRGAAYVGDLGAPGSPTVGTDSVLSLSGNQLAHAGVRAGDLLVATEGGGVTIAVRCLIRCVVRRIGRALDATHGEGHIAVASR